VGLDDLLKGLAVFDRGVKTFAVSTAVNDANEQLTQLQNQEDDRAQVLQQQTEISNSLALRLAGAGADAATIQAATGRLGVSAGAEFQAQQQRQAQESSQAFQLGVFEKESAKALAKESRVEATGIRREVRAEAKTKRLAKFEKEEITIPEEERREGRQERLEEIKAGKKATKEQQRVTEKQSSIVERSLKRVDQLTKKNNESIDEATTALKLLAQNNPVADQAIGTFMARASGEVGNLTEAEREMFRGSPAITRLASALFRKRSAGLITEADRADIARLATAMRQANVNAVRKKALKVSGQTSRIINKIGKGFSKEDVNDILVPGFEEVPQQQPQRAPQGASLTSPPTSLKSFLKEEE